MNVYTLCSCKIEQSIINNMEIEILSEAGADTRAKLIDRYFTVSGGQKTTSIVRKPPVGLTL